MWLPHEWWIDLKKSGTTWTFTAGVADLVKIKSSAKFRWQKDANREAINALRLMAYDIRDVGWTKFRCHSRIPGAHRAFCGAQVGDSPNLQNYGSEPCGNCYRILESIQGSDEPETDVKKHFRYISFNSERIPVGLQQALETLKLAMCADKNSQWKLRRIPLEPDIFPLSPDVPSRVGLLRGAGNSINPYVGAKFIKAFMEVKYGI